MSLALQLPSSLTVGPLAPYKRCVSHSCIVHTCVDRDSTIWFFVFFFSSLVAEPRSSTGALDNYFDMRQGKAESIQDYIFREEILTVALQKDTAIDLDEKI